MRLLRDLFSHARMHAQGAANDAELEMLVAASAGLNPLMPRSKLHALHDQRVSDAAFAQFDLFLIELKKGVPVQHLTGMQAFYGLELEVSADVLIPRPETEFMVSQMLEEKRSPPYARVAEIGTGSGAIALALLQSDFAQTVIASEVSTPAILVARRNARRILGPEHEKRLQIVATSDPLRDPVDVLTDALGGRRVEILVSNPPYLEETEAEVTAQVAQHEPRTALFVDAKIGDSLWFYRKIAAGAVRILEPKGVVWLELSDLRAAQTRKLFDPTIWLTELRRDLAGRERVLRAELKS